MRISDWSSDVCSSDLTGNRDRPAGPVVLAVEVAVAFQLDEVRRDIIPPPTVQPIFRPFVIVAREAALRMHAIDRLTATEKPGLHHRNMPRRRIAGSRPRLGEQVRSVEVGL